MSPELLFTPKWKDTIIPRGGTIREALVAINASGALMACIVSETMELQAILTDSDIRRALLNGATLEGEAWPWANKTPMVALSHMPIHELSALAEKQGIREFPIVDDAGRLVDIFILAVHHERVETSPQSKETLSFPPLSNPILIQAGGLGTRLRSVVGDRPKPLALVGDKPILETLILQAAANGFRKFYVSTNYQANLIEEHLASEKYKSLDIVSVRESERLGTAGSIGLIAEEVKEPLLVCNADVLTTVPFRNIMQHHMREEADITVSVRPYSMTVPYGVVETKNGLISRITEKPERSFLVNAGIYILNPDVCRLVSRNRYLDMPNLIEMAMSNQATRVTPFLLHEYWIDIGRPEDFYRANKDFDIFFGNQ
jgi:dTDP-glucose pyrophosphorylase